ncbi:hypothetical protein GCM10010385_26090 [Streptomyces geysiriensis]|nr:hypothetical protein GCM10010385_26090 [Streptomyces geysiriensis]
MPLLSSQARSLGRRAVIEFTFQVAMRMSHNLPGGTDNAAPLPAGPGHRCAGAAVFAPRAA